MKRWTEDEIDECLLLLNEGKNYNYISSKLKRSKKSVEEKLKKLGYSYRKVNKDNSDFKIHKDCEYCKTPFVSYIKHNRKFCSQSCSASYNNTLKKANKKCLNCGIEIPKRNKYCSVRCQWTYKSDIIKHRIESGDTTLHPTQYKKYLINKHGNKCMKCGWCEVNPQTKNVPIQLDHINGDSDDNRLINLRLLCPNCHSLTPTYGILNKGNGRSERQRYRNQLKDLTIDELIKEKEKTN